MRVVLADDHNLVRRGIRALLESIPGVEVVAETGNGREALELIESKRPDVAVLDITMPGLNGLEVAARAAKEAPSTRVLLLSMHAGEAYVAQALRAGVSGYLLKDAADDELALALKAVERGDVYLSPQISKHLVERLARASDAEPDPLAGLTRASARSCSSWPRVIRRRRSRACSTSARRRSRRTAARSWNGSACTT